MNVKLKVLTIGTFFFLGGVAVVAQNKKKDTIKERQIDEVVLVGYTSKKKEAITTSVSTIKASEINNVPVANFVQNLGGRMAGVDIAVGSGQPGSGGNIIVRGIGSINGGNTPLYIVDGIPLSSTAFASLNQNDFEEITVLKDAASKAQYGASGGAGVVLVRTKNGKNGFKVQYTGQVGISERGKQNYELMNASQWLEWNRLWGNFSDSDVAFYKDKGVDTDWRKTFFRTGFSMSNDVAISGGANNTNYYLSLAQFSQEGISLASNLDRYTLNAKINSGNGRNFRFGFQTNLGFSKLNNIRGEAGVFTNNPYFAVATAPVFTPYNPDGTYGVNQGLFDAASLRLNYGARALEQTLEGKNGRNQIKILSNVYGEYDFSPHLTARVAGGVDFTQNNTTSYNNPNTYYGSTTSPGQSGSLSKSIANWTTLNTNARLTYKNSWNSVHNFEAFILGEYIGRFRESFGYTGYGLDKALGNTPAAITVSSTILPAVSGGSTRFTVLSGLGFASYNYDNKYFIDANIRIDASSQFAKNKKSGTFGGASIAWAINKENFLLNSKVSTLKLRASYGVTGNTGDPTSLNPYNDTQYLNYAGLYDGVRTLSVGTPYNPDYRWEKERQVNLGLDFGFFNNRISGAFDVYDRRTNDLFVTYNLSATSGYTGIGNYNGGSMSNKGIEFDLRGDVIRNDDLKVSLFANFAYNKNKILDLGQVRQFESGTSIIRVGEEFGSHYIVGWVGVNPQTGAPIYQDINGNPTEIYNASNSKTGFGTYIPPYKGGFGLDLNYKGFFLNTLFQWKSGFSRFNNQRFFQENPNFWYLNQNVSQLDIWTTPGQVTDVQGAAYKVEFSSKFIEDASFLRFKNVRLGYEFPKSLLANSGLKGVSIFADINNLYTWTKWTGFDPDDDNNIAQYEYPTPRIITIGTTITF
ncbi:MULTISPECIES: SusC/RagA family TonB-linked outer membrane protein [unclassified Chryseobacterium]|uniref:SusC/RagA family TonB-linked outer membrane protein n=1 Tax=unclassified Chryseobacterium TaxID=2593645 RepID=UPI0030188BF1